MACEYIDYYARIVRRRQEQERAAMMARLRVRDEEYERQFGPTKHGRIGSPRGSLTQWEICSAAMR